MADNMKVFIVMLVALAACTLLAVSSENKQSRKAESICSIKGKSTYIYYGTEYSCFNGAKL